MYKTIHNLFFTFQSCLLPKFFHAKPSHLQTKNPNNGFLNILL